MKRRVIMGRFANLFHGFRTAGLHASRVLFHHDAAQRRIEAVPRRSASGVAGPLLSLAGRRLLSDQSAMAIFGEDG